MVPIMCLARYIRAVRLNYHVNGPNNHCLRTAKNRNSRSLAGNWGILYQLLLKGMLEYSESIGTAHIFGLEEEVPFVIGVGRSQRNYGIYD